jgi:hypothetical protein
MKVRDMEVQIRPHSSHSRPSTSTARRQSLDQRLFQGDNLRDAKKRLEDSLRRIEHSYASSSSSEYPAHSGQDGCDRCAGKRRDIGGAYYIYFLNSLPGIWSSEASEEYRHKLNRTYNDPESSLDDLHSVFRSAVRNYLKQNLGSKYGPSRAELEEMFNEERSTSEILNTCLEKAQQRAPNRNAASFIAELQHIRTPEERAQLYAKYYCSYFWTDPSHVKNFKAKYARMFEQLMPYDEVVAAMRKEAAESQSSKLAGLRRQLNELEMAQSAHLKAQARKDQKMRDREPSPGMVQCSLPGCANEVDLATDETIECAVCEWLERRGSEKGRAFYCCLDHAEEDFVSFLLRASTSANATQDEHDRNDHQCCMGARCFYFPQAGPPGETGDGGICQDCADEEFTSYFCSQDCYHHNLVSFYTHRYLMKLT